MSDGEQIAADQTGGASLSRCRLKRVRLRRVPTTIWSPASEKLMRSLEELRLHKRDKEWVGNDDEGGGGGVLSGKLNGGVNEKSIPYWFIRSNEWDLVIKSERSVDTVPISTVTMQKSVPSPIFSLAYQSSRKILEPTEWAFFRVFLSNIVCDHAGKWTLDISLHSAYFFSGIMKSTVKRG